MLRPIHVFRHLLREHLYVVSDGRSFETSQSAVAYQGELDKGATPDLTPLIPATDSSNARELARRQRSSIESLNIRRIFTHSQKSVSHVSYSESCLL